MNILITGVRGFVSFNFVRVLVSENTIYGMDIIVPKKEGVAKTFFLKRLEECRPPED